MVEGDDFVDVVSFNQFVFVQQGVELVFIMCEVYCDWFGFQFEEVDDWCVMQVDVFDVKVQVGRQCFVEYEVQCDVVGICMEVKGFYVVEVDEQEFFVECEIFLQQFIICKCGIVGGLQVFVCFEVNLLEVVGVWVVDVR